MLSATDVLTAKLKAMDEHACDFGPLIRVARRIREQVDWAQVRSDVQDNDFAVACVFLLDRLRIAGS